jgi:hypothetical protein
VQLATDTALAAAVEGPDRVVVHKLEADWNRNGLYDHALSDLTEWVVSVGNQRDMLGSLPEQTTIIEGFISAKLDVTLQGSRNGDGGKDVVDLLSTLRTDSPLYGQARTGVAIRWRIGIATAAGTVPMIDQFTGTISTFKADNAPRQVTLSCLDGTDRLHNPINLPVYGLYNWDTNLIQQQPQSGKFRINSHWVIDYVLRQNGIYQSPPNMPGCIYSATGHGSLIPEIGHQFDLSGVDGVFADSDSSVVPGKWGYAFSGGPKFFAQWFSKADAAFNPVVNRSYLFQAMVDYSVVPNQRPASSGTVFAIGSDRSLFAPGSISLAIRVLATGRIVAEFYNGSSIVVTVNGPVLTAPIWTQVWVKVDFGATLANSVVSFPTLTVNPVNLSALTSTPVVWPFATVLTQNSFPITNLQFADVTGLGATTLYDPTAWVSQCDLDVGLNEFVSLPIIRGSDSLNVLKSVVGSEFGVAGFTEAGRFFFKNRNTLRKNNLAIDKVYNSDTNLQQASVQEQAGQIRNSIVAKTKYVSRPSAYRQVFTLQNFNDIQAPSGTSIFKVTLSDPCLLNEGSDLLVENPWSGNFGFGHKFHTIDPFSADVLTGVAVAVWTDPVALAQGRDEAFFRVTNTNLNTVRFGTTTGQVALEVAGLPNVDSPEEVRAYERASSIAKYGRQTLELEADPWRQLQAFVGPLATSLLKDLKAPVPLLNPITTVGDPRVQLADTALLQDLMGIGGPLQVGVYSIQRTISDRKLTDVLVVRAYGTLSRWILGHPTLSVLGQTTIPG